MTAIKYSSAVTCNLIAGLFSNHKAGDLCPGITQTTSVKFVVPKLFCAFPRNEPANPAEYLNERPEMTSHGGKPKKAKTTKRN